MKFESFEVEEKFYELHRQYGINHCNFGSTYERRAFTSIDLDELEDGFKEMKKIFDSM
jgi:hypothetical protein